jgi:hypothetical protein
MIEGYKSYVLPNFICTRVMVENTLFEGKLEIADHGGRAV